MNDVESGYDVYRERLKAKQEGIAEGRAMVKTKIVYRKAPKLNSRIDRINNNINKFLNKRIKAKGNLKNIGRATYVIRF